MDIEELKQYAKKIFDVHPDTEIDNLQEFIYLHSRKREYDYALLLLAKYMARYIDEIQDKSTT